jgi:hypothetical protein
MMIEEEDCPAGAEDCKYPDKYEMALVEEIMRTIEQYHKGKEADPCPVCLRNTLLAVAALLHVQSRRRSLPAGQAKCDEAEFGEAALGRLRDVIEAANSIPNSSKH